MIGRNLWLRLLAGPAEPRPAPAPAPATTPAGSAASAGAALDRYEPLPPVVLPSPLAASLTGSGYFGVGARGAAVANLPSTPPATPPVAAPLSPEALARWVGAEPLANKERQERRIVELALVAMERKPAHLQDLILSDCSSLTSLPEGLRVGGTLDLANCSALTHLPQGLRVGNALNLRGCRALRSLPDGLRVGGNCNVAFCANLRGLPAGLWVEGSLSVSHCIRFESVPACLRLTGHLDLSYCQALVSLPPNIVRWGALASGEARLVDLRGTNLPPSVKAALQASRSLGVQFLFDVLGIMLEPAAFATLGCAQAFWLAASRLNEGRAQADAHEAGAAPWQLDLTAWQLSCSQQDDLLLFLHRLRGTADFLHARSRAHLAGRVVLLLGAMEDDERLREACCAKIDEALGGCVDSILWVMNQLEVMVHVYLAEQGDQEEGALRDLARGMMRLEVVHEHARRKSAELLHLEEVEVFLAFEVRLRDGLQLPVSSRHMLFERWADLKKWDVQQAYLDAVAATQDPGQIEAFLQAWHPWQLHQRRQQAKLFCWASLPVQAAASAEQSELVCAFTQEPASALREPVSFVTGGLRQVCEASYLLAWWVVHATDPILHLPLALTDLKRA